MSDRIVLVTGSREYAKAQAVLIELERVKPDVVIQGGATGADYLAAMWAKTRGVSCLTFPADWKAHGKSAGPRRNQEMARHAANLQAQGCEVIVLAFPGGKGTENMVKEAEAAGLRVERVAS